ncbi:MAG TPA: peroxiredoxin [Acidimicrobiales bacterium]|nr:peroxiredoxin [Acidimicrobiales bacterium]
MTVSVGDKVPDVEVRTMGAEGPKAVKTSEVLGRGRVVLFAVPGAFTPTCSKAHLPGFVNNAEALTGKGVDTIACISVNDAWVMDAWAQSQGVGDKIVMLADGSAEFTQAMGLVMDATGAGMGLRSKRYAAVIEDGIITRLDVEPKPGLDVSSCEAVLSHL